MTSVTHGGSEIKWSRKELTFYYYCISWVLNHSTDLGLSHDAWLLGGSNNTEFRSSPGSRSLSCCRLAAGGAKPEAKLSLHLPSALTRNTLPAFNRLDGPSSGTACLHADPNPAAVPAGQATLAATGNCAFIQSPDKWKKVCTDFRRLNSSLSLIHLRKVGSTACAHRYKECNVLFLWFFIAF